MKLRVIEDVERADDWTNTTSRYAIVYDQLVDLDSPDGPVPVSAYVGLRKDDAYIRSDGHRLVATKPAPQNSYGRADIGPMKWVPPTAPKADQR